jgi:hypothetical protein
MDFLRLILGLGNTGFGSQQNSTGMDMRRMRTNKVGYG